MTESATIDWFGWWETSVFSESTAIFTSSFGWIWILLVNITTMEWTALKIL